MENCRNKNTAWVLLNFIQRVQSASKTANKNHGYFCLFDITLKRPIAVFAIGYVPAEKTEKYYNLSIEKAQRILNQPTYKDNGVIRGRRYIFSFAGLEEKKEDSIAILLIATKCLKEIDPGEAEYLAIQINLFLEKIHNLSEISRKP